MSTVTVESSPYVLQPTDTLILAAALQVVPMFSFASWQPAQYADVAEDATAMNEVVFGVGNNKITFYGNAAKGRQTLANEPQSTAYF